MFKQNKSIFLALFLTPVLIVGSSCNSEAQSGMFNRFFGGENCETNEPASFCASDGNTNILVFIDKSSSVQWDSERKNEHLEFLKGKLEMLKSSGDKIRGTFIHENTRGAAPFLQKVHKVECPLCEDYANEGRLTQQRFETNYAKQNESLRESYYEAIGEGWDLKNMNSTRANTDIWGTIEVMSDFFSGTKATDQNYVFIISDMLESHKGNGRRDFTHKAPTNKAMAEEFANADVKWIERELNLNKSNLSNIQVYVLANNTSTGGNQFAMLKIYWQELFNALGLNKELEFR